MTRGDTVIVAAGGGYGSKPRPALVIQSDLLLRRENVVLLMFTTEDQQTPTIRPSYLPDDGNGLLQPSVLMADIPITVRRTKVSRVIGRLSPTDMQRAERALMLVLGLTRSRASESE